MDEMGCLEFWFICVDIDVMWVYIVAAGGCDVHNRMLDMLIKITQC
jgi:hypothetical protein